MSSASPQDKSAPGEASSGAGGGINHLYALHNRQEQKNSADIVPGMIRVFEFSVYAILDRGASLYFVMLYVSINFEIIPKQLSEPFSVSTLLVNPFLQKESIMIVLFSSVTRISLLI